MLSPVRDPSASRAATTAVVWFRRDLRLADNRALCAALSQSDQVVPLFVWDPVLMNASGPNRLGFLAGCVDMLNRSLDGQLVVRSGDPVRAVAQAAAEANATEVFVSGDYGPYGSVRDRRAAATWDGEVEVVAVDSPYAVTPGTLFTKAGTAFQVFSAFARAWREHGWSPPAPRPSTGRVSRAGLRDDGPTTARAPRCSLPPAGEAAAHRLLETFLRSGAGRYGHERDRLGSESTSRLSPYLKFGCLHPRQILDGLDPRLGSHEAFETELCWREFFAHVLFHRPDAAREPYRPAWRGFRVDTGRDADLRFRAWAHGQTGYPIVDAAMRQLLAEGWMHNRARMITASFLVKDLHVDWRRGARWFMAHLVDGDLASNQLNWQWVAGPGTDAAPYFRVFNPVVQGRKFDPDGTYIKRWVPELRPLSGASIHEPWSYTDPTPYPRPVVDHATERREALERYGHLRNRPHP